MIVSGAKPVTVPTILDNLCYITLIKGVMIDGFQKEREW